MNERILELAEQAGIEFDDSFSSEPETIYYLKLSDFEKFAELIVQKCAEACRRVGELEQEAATGQMYADAVLEHFGVQK